MVSRVKGKELGTGHSGLFDWYLQRLSAVVLACLLPMALMLVWWVYDGGWSQLELLTWLDSFVVRVLHTLLILALMAHGYVGLKVIFEDYIHTGWRVLLLGLMLVAMVLFAVWWLALIWAWGG